MASNMIVIDPLREPGWDDMVDSFPDATVYHRRCWLQVIASTYPQAVPLAVVKKEGSVRAALPACVVKSRLTGKRMVSLPFTSYCNPLYGDPEDCPSLIDAILEASKGHDASFYELRTLNTIPGGEHRLKKHAYHMTHILDLEGGFGKVKKNISNNIVTNKKRAEKAGVMVREAANERDLRAFYTVHAVTRKKQGFPIQPFAFFRNMFAFMGPSGNVRFLLAEQEGRVIAGIVLFLHGHTVSYEIGASLPSSLEARPNHLLLWTAVESSCAEGRKFFDFGKSPPDNPGLVEFKRRWGAQSVDCPYYYFPEIAGMMAVEQNSLKHRAMRTLYSHAPLAVSQLLGRSIYQHLG